MKLFLTAMTVFMLVGSSDSFAWCPGPCPQGNKECSNDNDCKKPQTCNHMPGWNCHCCEIPGKP